MGGDGAHSPGRVVKMARIEHGMSQRQLAVEFTGRTGHKWTESMVSKLERDTRHFVVELVPVLTDIFPTWPATWYIYGVGTTLPDLRYSGVAEPLTPMPVLVAA